MAIRLSRELERLGMTWDDLAREIGASRDATIRMKSGERPYRLRAIRVARAVGWRGDPMELFRKEGKAKGADGMDNENMTLEDIHEKHRKAVNEGIARAFMPLVEDMGLDPEEILGEAAPAKEPGENRKRADAELARLQAARDEAMRDYETFDFSSVALDAQEREAIRRDALEELGRPRNAAEQRKLDMRIKATVNDAVRAKREAKRQELRAAAVEASRAVLLAEEAMGSIEHEEAVRAAAAAMERKDREDAVKRRIVGTKDAAKRRRLIAENMDLFEA